LKLIDMAMNPKVQLPLDLSVFGELDMNNNLTTGTSAAAVTNTNDDTAMTTTMTPTTITTDSTDKVPRDSDTRTAITETTMNKEGSTQNTLDEVDLGQPSLEMDGNIDIPGVDGGGNNSNKTLEGLEQSAGTTTGSTDINTNKDAEEAATIHTIHIPLTGASGTKKKRKPKFRVRAKPGGPKGKTKKNV
jgi:hypothetical protein